jgi:membrane-bound serine protease (ClpP class)
MSNRGLPRSVSLRAAGFGALILAGAAVGFTPGASADFARGAVDGPAGSTPPHERTVVHVPVTGTIELGLAPFIARAIREAEDGGAAAVVLDVDTPGGRVDAAWQIIDDVRETDIPVYAFVNRRALSAGAMIALAADDLYMRPGSTIGAATPVDGEGTRASEKMVSAMRSEFRALAEDRGFDPQIAAAMVDENIEVPGVVAAGQLLTLTTGEALELGVATAVVADYEALLEATGLAGSATLTTRPNWAEAVVRFLSNPLVAPFLLSFGFLGLIIEIKTPTFGLAGGIGLLSLAAFFGARYIVNLAGMEELLLLVAGLGLIAAEVFVIPGLGLAGVAGTLAVLASATLSMVGSYPSMSEVISSFGFVAVAILLLAVFAFALVRHLPYSRSLKGILLSDATTREAGYLSAPDRQDLIGAVGRTITDLRPSGTAVFGDERVDVVTEGPFIDAGVPVKILRAEGYRHVVREVPPATSDTSHSSQGSDAT